MSPRRYKVTAEPTFDGRYQWWLKWWDPAVARALGDKEGWTNVYGIQGVVDTLEEAEAEGRRGAAWHRWKMSQPPVDVAEFTEDDLEEYVP